ncbi:MAG: hypothetical protein MJ231_01770 [bacterium]|nr:hypothetical protein [bacterium]
MKIGSHIWHWHLASDGTLMIYNKNDLYWEIENCAEYSKTQINIIAKEFILQNQHILYSDN